MTVSVLHPADVASGCVATARAAVSAGLGSPTGSLSDHELGAVVTELAAVESQVAAWRLELAREAERRQVSDRTTDTDTASWLSRLTTDPRESASSGLWLGRRLEETYAATRAAFASGHLRADQVRVIVSAGDRAPDGFTPAQLAEAETALVAKATGAGTRAGRPMGARMVRIAARRMFETISPDVADRHESDQLQDEERRAQDATWFSLSDNGNGTWSGRFVIPELQGRLFSTWLGRLTAPRRQSTRARAVAADDPTGISTPSHTERLGSALLELVEHLPADGWGSGTAIGVLVTMPLDGLMTGIGAAGLDAGARCSAGAARRLACNAGLIPAVLGGESLPLDLGRSRRLHGEPQRRALAVAHDTCAVTSCERPFTWTEVHHPHAWSDGGPTDLANALPLCGHHHRRAHDGRFELREHGPGDWRFTPRQPVLRT